jgi:hypothetical protein
MTLGLRQGDVKGMRRLQDRRVVFSVSFPADLERELARLAETRGKSRSGMVAEIVASAMSAKRIEGEAPSLKTRRTS